MSLYSIARGYAGWAFSITKKITRTAPISILTVVASTLVSQLSLLLAFLLPLKIILLIGSRGIPAYFPHPFAAFNRDALVLVLGAAAVSFYLLHLLAERVTAFYSERAAVGVLEQAGKLTLFANQEEMARGAVRKLARGMAAAIFALAALAAITLLHPSVALVLAGWCVLVFFGTWTASASSQTCRAWLEANATSFISSMASVGFFAVMASMIAEFLLGVPLHILFAVVSLILSRQILQRISASLKDALTLNAQRQQINALFFRGHTVITQTPDRDGGLWDLCSPEKLGEWLVPFVAEITGQPTSDVRPTAWRETGMTDIITFEVSVAEANKKSAKYLVKLYSSRRRILAARESTLLSVVHPESLPCLPFLGSRRIGEVECHLFRQPEARQMRPKEVNEKVKCFLQACWVHEPNPSLVQRYRRSHQLLFQQLSTRLGERLSRVALTPQNEIVVSNFINAVESIRKQLEALPLFIYCPDAGAGTLLKLEKGNVLAMEWGRWTLEPVGAGWPTDKAALAAIKPWLEEARAQRPALIGISAEQVQLAACAFSFQRLYTRQRYNSALRLLPAMLACIDAIESLEADRIAQEQTMTVLKKTGS